MRLLCPHCRKEVQVGEHLAGQVSTCPLCQKPFRVPVPPSASAGTSQAATVPPSVAPSTSSVPPPSAGAAGWDTAARGMAPSPGVPTSAPPAPGYTPTFSPSAATPPYVPPISPQPPISSPLGATGPAAPSLPVSPGVAASPTLPPPVPSPGYSDSIQLLVLSPVKLQFLQFLGMLLLAVLLFFPWLRVPPGTGILFQQNEFQLAFGRGTGELKDKIEPGVSPLGIIFFFLALFSAILSGLLLLAAKLDWPELRPYLRFRHLLTGGLILLLATILSLQVLIGFPLNAAWTATAKLSDEDAKKVYQAVETAQVSWLDVLARSVIKNPEEHIGWGWGLYGTCLLLILLVALALLDFWQQRRSSPLPPRLLLEK
jgi:hypothetical protein